MKTACIYHSIDLDGWMSAAIVKHWFIKNYNEPETSSFKTSIRGIKNMIEFIDYNYGQPIPDLSEYDRIIMCDISFPKEEMEKIAFKLIWIDHHISAIMQLNTNPNIYNAEGLRDTKFAACELIWKFFFPNEPMPEIVRLLGRYDCFGHKFTKEDESRRLTLLEYVKSTTRWMSKEEQDELANLNIKLLEEQKVLEFQYGARQSISNYEEAYKYLELSINPRKGDATGIILENGKSIYQYLCTEAKQTYKNGFEIIFHYYTEPYQGNEDGYHKIRFICINKERFNPINFGIDYHKDGYDGAACFHYANGMWNFSLYNDNGEVDCSQIAKQYGGGGHKGAAGFRCDFETFKSVIVK